MKEDPIPRLRDELSRRELTSAEARELADWLHAHPEADARWRADALVSRALRGLSERPIPSNFTALVMAEVDRLERRPTSARPWELEWRGWLRRHRAWIGATAVVVLTGGMAWQAQVFKRDAELARQVAPLRVLGEISPAILEDFDAIRSFSERPAPVDFELLAALQP